MAGLSPSAILLTFDAIHGRSMRYRGQVFWAWADPTLQYRSHEERLKCGVTLDAWVRTSKTGAVQLFIGVYEATGLPRIEESYDSMPGETMTTALLWGVGRARFLAKAASSKDPPASTVVD